MIRSTFRIDPCRRLIRFYVNNIVEKSLHQYTSDIDKELTEDIRLEFISDFTCAMDSGSMILQRLKISNVE